MQNVTEFNRVSGFVKISSIDCKTGETRLLVDTPNKILYTGARGMAYSLSGKEHACVWGMYIGYCNQAVFVPKTIDLAYSQPFQEFTVPFGYLREPLTFTPTYMSSSPAYKDNVALFTTMISSSSVEHGDVFTPNVSNIYEIGLVMALDPSSDTQDLVVARTNFNPLTYDSNFNLSITWGIKFLA